MKEYHQSVLMKEILEYLDPRCDDVIVDATFGFGGHSGEIVKRIGKNGKIVGVEQDSQIVELVQSGIDKKRIELVNDNFSELKSILKKRKIKQIDGILFDLGLSSYHFDEMKAGFSFQDPTLDMRLDRKKGQTASEMVNSISEKELADLLYQNADEYKSRRIARAIVEERKKKRITSSSELTRLIEKTVRKTGRINVATKTFQALRIAINNELEILNQSLPVAINLLKKNGKIVVISFHSKEDKIVKESFKRFQSEGKIRILTKKPVQATYEEKKRNPRSRSAKLRAAQVI